MNPIEMSLNLKSLKMIDKSAVRIIDMSFRVAMFDFDVYKNKYVSFFDIFNLFM